MQLLSKLDYKCLIYLMSGVLSDAILFMEDYYLPNVW